MDDADAATPSLYNTANESSPTSTSRPFLTPHSSPNSSRESGSDQQSPHADREGFHRLLGARESKAEATPSILKRYIDSYEPSIAGSDQARSSEMPVTTRHQEAAHLASQASSPLPARSSRAKSPILREDMLRGYSSHSPSYAKAVEKSVDVVVSSLVSRGRLREGHGVRELYAQSFKDPGSKNLLDALLRIRATERQLIDFERYVDDVNKLREPSPTVVIPLRQPPTVEPENETRDAPGEASDRATSNGPAQAVGKGSQDVDEQSPESERVPGTHGDRKVRLNEADQDGVCAPTLSHLAESSTNAESSTTIMEKALPKKRKRRREGELEETSAQEPATAEEAVQALMAQERAESPPKYESGLSLERDPQKSRICVPPAPAPRRQQKRNRIFFGANGPVFARSIFDRDPGR